MNLSLTRRMKIALAALLGLNFDGSVWSAFDEFFHRNSYCLSRCSEDEAA
jgi:hypothetical protein